MLRCDNLIALAIICNFFSPMLDVSRCIQSRTLNIPTDVFSMVKLNTSISTIDHYLFRRLITERVVTHSTSSVTADEIISLFTALSSRKPKVWPTWWSARGRRNYRSSPRTNPRERKREREREGERAHNELRSSHAIQEGNKPRMVGIDGTPFISYWPVIHISRS